MLKRENILWVGEKYCHCNPNTGWTSNLEDLVYTFQQNKPEFNLNTIHSDEAVLIYNSHIDKILVDYCVKNNIKIIFFSFINGENFNPSIKILKQLKKLNIITVIFWLDTYDKFAQEAIKKVKDLVNFSISIDNPIDFSKKDNKKYSNQHYLWPPRNNLFFYKQKQDIPISFIGSPGYNDRGLFLNALYKEIPSLVVSGGRIQENLSSYKYAELIRRSKIGLNFGLSPKRYFQTKGRSFEILASGSMLLESKNPSLEKFLQPGIDYIDFTNEKELIEKSLYYINNNEERIRIAENGYQKYQKLYTSQIFWDRIMTLIEDK